MASKTTSCVEMYPEVDYFDEDESCSPDVSNAVLNSSAMYSVDGGKMALTESAEIDNTAPKVSSFTQQHNMASQPLSSALSSTTHTSIGSVMGPQTTFLGGVGLSSSTEEDLSDTLPAHISEGLVSTLGKHGSSLVNPDGSLSRRLLSNPGEPAHNNGYDNAHNNLILRVNDILHNKSSSTDGSFQSYRVLDMLGQGTFGQVVKCEDCATGQLVAIKVIRNKSAYTNQAQTEIRLLKLLKEKYDPDDKAHLLRMLSHFKYKHHVCIVFELLSVNLYDVLRQNKFSGVSLPLIRSMGIQILEALLVLREAKVVHCDLKPENVLLCNIHSADIKVIDFGSACMESQPVYAYIQSRFYRAPEVLLGAGYDSAIDMWSAGCILAELFLGLPLFPGVSQYNQIARIIAALGMPPDSLLHRSANAKSLFVPRHAMDPFAAPTDGESSFVLKPPEVWSQENNNAPTSMRQYVKGWLLADVIGMYPLRCEEDGKEPSPVARMRELDLRAKLLHLLQGLLRWEARERWSPWVALQHPFFTNAPLSSFDAIALHKEEKVRIRRAEKQRREQARREMELKREEEDRARRAAASSMPLPLEEQARRVLQPAARRVPEVYARAEVDAKVCALDTAARSIASDPQDSVTTTPPSSMGSLPPVAIAATPLSTGTSHTSPSTLHGSLARLQVSLPALSVTASGHTPTSHRSSGSMLSLSSPASSTASTPYTAPRPPTQQMLMTPQSHAQASRHIQSRFQAAAGVPMSSPTNSQVSTSTTLSLPTAPPQRASGVSSIASMSVAETPAYTAASASGSVTATAMPYLALSSQQYASSDAAAGTAGDICSVPVLRPAYTDALVPVSASTVYASAAPTGLDASFSGDVNQAAALAPYTVASGVHMLYRNFSAPSHTNTAAAPLTYTAAVSTGGHNPQKQPAPLPILHQHQHYLPMPQSHPPVPDAAPNTAPAGAYPPASTSMAVAPTGPLPALPHSSQSAQQRNALARQALPIAIPARVYTHSHARASSQQVSPNAPYGALPPSSRDSDGISEVSSVRVFAERILAHRERDRSRTDSAHVTAASASASTTPQFPSLSASFSGRSPAARSAPTSAASSVHSTPISPPRHAPRSPQRPSFTLSHASPSRTSASRVPPSPQRVQPRAGAQSNSGFTNTSSPRASRALYSAQAPVAAASMSMTVPTHPTISHAP